MDPEDVDFTSEKYCPQCGRLADHRLPAVGWNRCEHCRLYFDDEGNDMDEFSKNFMKDMLARRDAFLDKLLFHVRKHLADEPAEHPVKQLLDGMNIHDPGATLPGIVLSNLVIWTQQYQQTQRPSFDLQEQHDPDAYFGRLTQVFVIDFIAECQRFLDSLNTVDRQMVMNCSQLPAYDMGVFRVIKLLKAYR